MQTKLKWRKSFFSNIYGIYSNGQQIGKLKDKSFSQTAIGELNGQEYIFQTKGFFKQKTHIVDAVDNKTIGEINYNNWMKKETISVDDKTINLKYDNLWNTKWRIYDSGGIHIKYSGSLNGGEIETNIDDELLLLSGLFVTNYYWQTTIVILVAVYIPVWVTLII